MSIKSGFNIINWEDRLPLDIVSLSFSNEYLKELCIRHSESDRHGFDPSHPTISLLVEDIGDGFYHIGIRDYFIGRQVDLGEGTYEVEIDESAMRGWSSLEKILTDVRHRIDSGEIDLYAELKAYYDVFEKDSSSNASLLSSPFVTTNAKNHEGADLQKSRPLEAEFRDYLTNEAKSKTTGRPYSQNTVSEYLSAINVICREEGLSFQDLFDSADSVCNQYEIGGCKEHLGKRGHNAYRNALRRFVEFVSKRAGLQEQR